MEPLLLDAYAICRTEGHLWKPTTPIRSICERCNAGHEHWLSPEEVKALPILERTPALSLWMNFELTCQGCGAKDGSWSAREMNFMWCSGCMDMSAWRVTGMLNVLYRLGYEDGTPL